MKFIDLTGMRFGRLLVIKRENNIRRYATWLCQCDCGKKVIVRSGSLISENTKSCNCLKRETRKILNTTHGLCNTRLYSTWVHMKTRCLNPKDSAYKNYGGRGIIVCKEWLCFENFYQWAINNGYADNLLLDRIDNNGNYEPNNCRWATRKTQNRNRRNNKHITFNGITKTYSEWEEFLGVPKDTIRTRIRRGWSDEKALTKPS